MNSILRTGRGLPLIALFLSLSMILQAGLAIAQSDIGVDNDGPSFTDISIIEIDEVIFVNVDIRDLNGWNDIYSINVTVFDNQNRPICRVNYMQYPSLSSTSVPTIIWNETTGNYLDRTRSTWLPLAIEPWNTPTSGRVEIGLRVSFAFQKFSGEAINILGTDRGLLICEYNGPFSAEYTPAPAFENVAVPISLSSVIALGAALFLVYRRFKNNKLARAVEATHAAEE